MGNTVSNIVEKLTPSTFSGKENERHRIICCGLDSSGKTTLMYMLNPGHVTSTIPTIGFHVEESDYGVLNIFSWDVGGRCIMRPLFRHYYQSTAGLVFIIDIAAHNSDWNSMAADELKRLLAEPSLIGIPLLILGNKADLPSAMSQEQVEELVDLKSIQRTREATVRRISAKNHKTDSEPVTEAFSWLQQQIPHPQRQVVVSNTNVTTNTGITSKDKEESSSSALPPSLLVRGDLKATSASGGGAAA